MSIRSHAATAAVAAAVSAAVVYPLTAYRGLCRYPDISPGDWLSFAGSVVGVAAVFFAIAANDAWQSARRRQTLVDLLNVAQKRLMNLKLVGSDTVVGVPDMVSDMADMTRRKLRRAEQLVQADPGEMEAKFGIEYSPKFVEAALTGLQKIVDDSDRPLEEREQIFEDVQRAINFLRPESDVRRMIVKYATRRSWWQKARSLFHA